jgi:hypothetical protein
MGKWWLVEGVIVEIDNRVYRLRIDKVGDLMAGIYPIEYYGHAMKPTGVPFDCMPAWAEKIKFHEGYCEFWFGDNELDYRVLTIPFPKCPEAWEGKTFKITDELRKLIDVEKM